MASPEKVFQEAIGWLASEHHFFIGLKRDLALLKADLDEAKTKAQVKDIKLCFKDFRYLGISEARFNQRERHIEQILKELSDRRITVTGSIKEIPELLQRLHAEAANLIRSSSLHEGKIRDFLIHLQKEIEDHEIEQAQALLMELTRLIDGAERWLAALSTDLKLAQEILQELEEGKDSGLEDLTKKETRTALEAMLKKVGWKDVSSYSYPDACVVTGIISGQFLKIKMIPAEKTIRLTFSQPPGTQWPQKKFAIEYDILKQRARGQTFRNFLSKLLPELYGASIPWALGGPGNGDDLPKIVREALGS